MAIYHLDLKTISREKGQSVIAAAAYRSGDRLYSEEEEKAKDYRRKQQEVKHSEIMLPEHAPKEYQDREKLWNAVEKKENRVNSRLAKEMVVALPAELTREQQIELLREYVKENITDKGIIADVNIHDKEDGNPHAHILMTNRPMNERGEWMDRKQKIYILDKDGNKIYNPKTKNYKCQTISTTNWDAPETLQEWRENWSKATNKHLERSGHEERIDHRTYEAQGIEQTPTVHLGAAATQLERAGIQTAAGDYNREVRRVNAERWRVKQEKEQLKEREQTKIQTVDLAADERPATTKPTEERQPEKTLEEKLEAIETGLTRDDRHNAEQATAAKELGKKHIDGYYDTNNKIFKRTKQVQFTAERNAREKEIDKKIKEKKQEREKLGPKPKIFGREKYQRDYDKISEEIERLEAKKENLDKELEIRLKTDGNVDSRIYQEVKEKTLAEMTPEQRQEYQRGKAILETVGRIEKKALEIRHENEKAKKPQKEKTLDRGGRGL